MPALTRERILKTAIQIADRDGFEAVTLRGIAARLEVHVTSLYNHVPTREAITDGIVEILIDEAKLPTAPIGWEEWVRSFFAAICTVAVTHPGAFTALQRRPVQGPHATASFEVALTAFAKAGLGPEDAYSAVKATALTALAVGLEMGMASRGDAAETAIGELPPESFPELRLVAEAADPEAAWAFTLETLISGLRSELRRRPRGRSRA
ncbi:MAG: TetR family transcriptional regulator [Mycobacteriales bacterium]